MLYLLGLLWLFLAVSVVSDIFMGAMGVSVGVMVSWGWEGGPMGAHGALWIIASE